MTDEKKPSRAELGESAFKGLGGRVPRALVHGGHGERHLALDDRYRKNQPMASSLLVDDEYLYWSTTATLVDYSLEGAIYRRPRRGGAVTVVTVVFDLDGVLLAQDATHIYWLSRSRGAMYRVPKAGGVPEPMMTCDERVMIAASIAVDDHRVYWTVGDGSRAGGAVWSMGKEPAGTRAADDGATGRTN